MAERTLKLTFHGKIIDNLGYQMYQSPVASIAEMVSNSWDADAEEVKISLPDRIDEESEIVVEDDGHGMTFDECQEHYLNVGWCRRDDKTGQSSREKGRTVLGRKGIGKFAGFGIAEIIVIETISKFSGEKTTFKLDLNELRQGGYIQSGGEVPLLEFLPADNSRKSQHGTIIHLKKLKIPKRPSSDSFARSMARRFLLHQRVEDFNVYVNGVSIPEDEDLEKVEYIFPRDYSDDDRPPGTILEEDWGIATIDSKYSIKWKILFYRDPIEEEDLRGIAIFSRKKLAQKPFTFNLSGGLGGQHGLEYLSGQIQADFIDDFETDIIAIERQRINWEHAETQGFQEWGQNKIKELLKLWQTRRAEQRRLEIEQKISSFARRMAKLPSREQKTIRRAIEQLGKIPALSDAQFRSLGDAILQAWEQGRLRDLIDELATNEDITAESLISLLTEADVLMALNLAEAVRTKIEAIHGLKALIEQQALENDVRDYIAEKPYLLDPKWETFKKETSVRHIMSQAAKEAGILKEEASASRKRIDLALKSNEHLLVVEFVRPGKNLDWDHLSRCERYVFLIRNRVKAATALGITRISGLIVSDTRTNGADIDVKIATLLESDIAVHTWTTLLNDSESRWNEFLEIIGTRAPDDERIQSMRRSVSASIRSE